MFCVVGSRVRCRCPAGRIRSWPGPMADQVRRMPMPRGAWRWLSKLPGIGALFGSKTYNHARSELIIFMTPHVIQDETSLIEASDELKGRVKMLRRSVRDL